MLNVNEIFYLNKALEDKDIYGFSYEKSVSELISKGGNIKDIQDSLLKKGYLGEDGKLNDLSFQVIRNLQIYKKASKYIAINKILGSMDENNFITFFQETLDKEYEFKKTPKELLILALVKEYEFLQEYREIEEKEEIITLEEIAERLATKSLDEAIYVKKSTREGVEEYNIYFYEEDKTYKYDVLKETIKEINPKDIRIELTKTLEIERAGV